MKTKDFSVSWRRSRKPRKQRKYIRNAPLHIKGKFLSCHLSKELRQKHGTRNFRIRVGDKVKVMRGQFKGRVGKVERIDLKHTRVYVTGVEIAKKQGGKVIYPLHPSNLVIIEMQVDDKKRKKSVERKKKKE